MQKRKKRFNSLSKLQKGILFFSALVAVSLIGFVVAAINGDNPFIFLFKFNKKEHSVKLKTALVLDSYIGADDLTLDKTSFNNPINNPKFLIAKNGSTRGAIEANNEGYISQFLHKVFVDKNVQSLDIFESKVKDEPNLKVGVKFYLVPISLQGKDPKEFSDDDYKQLLDLSEFKYREVDDNNQQIGEEKDFFGSCVVFDNETYDTKDGKIKYKYNWLESKESNSEEIQVNILKFNNYYYYYPKDDFFTSEELRDNKKLQEKLSENSANFNYMGSSMDISSKKGIKPKKNSSSLSNNSNFGIPSIDDIEKEKPNKCFFYKKPDYPKLIAKKGNNYSKTEALILINFWNEYSLSNEFFYDEIEKKEIVSKTIYGDGTEELPLTLFTQVTYSLVDNKGEVHTVSTTPKGPKLKDMKLNDSNVGGTGTPSSKRRIQVIRTQGITQDKKISNPVL